MCKFFCKNKENDAAELTVPAELANIEKVLEFLDAELEKLGCSMKANAQIDVAADELFSNIARYAYGEGAGEATVRVEKAEGRQVRIEFIDSGMPFDPTSTEAPDVSLPADERGIGGLGIFIVKNTMDGLFYERRGNKNTVTIQKDLDA